MKDVRSEALLDEALIYLPALEIEVENSIIDMASGKKHIKDVLRDLENYKEAVHTIISASHIQISGNWRLY